MKNKIAATVVALIVIAFPFRRAFLSHEQPGFMMMLSFLLTLAGIILFFYLVNQPSKNH